MTTLRYHSSLNHESLDVGIGKRDNELTSLAIMCKGERTTVYLDRQDALDLARSILNAFEGRPATR
ncbi:hypothetical protein [Deinococcus peraridilitoris]|uniref:Uncharacterized protein n=1 Tax=Deinococcus peraridilitoris (strain DSM 19664 / LMG 22246 / CIP 109416 / KR-200) TaxID=937777 RepID=L0A383_DEIPD|nr:hypothetical protein [Deinococcus peraridilitoris]AFZ68358.1 hypothetical protein Deipe_2897 [Deinococcus peraridilitoris DSM 19664]